MGEAVAMTVWPTDAPYCTAYWPTAPPAPQIRTFSPFSVGSGVGKDADMPRKTCSAATAVCRGKEVRTACSKGAVPIYDRSATA